MSRKKKVIISVCSIVLIAISVVIYIERRVKADSFAIIGGADGPTSIIVAEKVGNNNTLFVVTGILAIVLISVAFVFRRKCDLFKNKGDNKK